MDAQEETNQRTNQTETERRMLMSMVRFKRTINKLREKEKNLKVQIEQRDASTQVPILKKRLAERDKEIDDLKKETTKLKSELEEIKKKELEEKSELEDAE
jgi:hypothetical protein